MDLKEYKFAIQDRKDFQSCVLHQYLFAHDIHVEEIEDPSKVPENYIPWGDILWIEKVLGKNIEPNYYPEFLKEYLFRNVWRLNIRPETKCFIKPSDRYKRFDGQIFEPGEASSETLLPPYWCSEIIDFIEEWRYYVAYGEVIAAEWYKGVTDLPCKAPDLKINWPKDWVGVVDFGQLKDGRISLIEAQNPFSFGWYNNDYKTFAEFIIIGWEYMRKKLTTDKSLVLSSNKENL